jgi:hypothetical protein
VKRSTQILNLVTQAGNSASKRNVQRRLPESSAADDV